jgi:hypothetical protein
VWILKSNFNTTPQVAALPETVKTNSNGAGKEPVEPSESLLDRGEKRTKCIRQLD